MSRQTTVPLSSSKDSFPRLLGLAARRIPSSKANEVRTPGSTNRYTHSAFMATPPPLQHLLPSTLPSAPPPVPVSQMDLHLRFAQAALEVPMQLFAQETKLWDQSRNASLSFWMHLTDLLLHTSAFTMHEAVEGVQLKTLARQCSAHKFQMDGTWGANSCRVRGRACVVLHDRCRALYSRAAGGCCAAGRCVLWGGSRGSAAVYSVQSSCRPGGPFNVGRSGVPGDRTQSPCPCLGGPYHGRKLNGIGSGPTCIVTARGLPSFDTQTSTHVIRALFQDPPPNFG